MLISNRQCRLVEILRRRGIVSVEELLTAACDGATDRADLVRTKKAIRNDLDRLRRAGVAVRWGRGFYSLVDVSIGD